MPETVTIVQKSTVDKFIQTFLSVLFLVQRHRLQPIFVWSSFTSIHCVCTTVPNQRKNYHINGEQVNLRDRQRHWESCDTMKMKHVSFITRRSLFICFLSFCAPLNFYMRARGAISRSRMETTIFFVSPLHKIIRHPFDALPSSSFTSLMNNWNARKDN